MVECRIFICKIVEKFDQHDWTPLRCPAVRCTTPAAAAGKNSHVGDIQSPQHAERKKMQSTNRPRSVLQQRVSRQAQAQNQTKPQANKACRNKCLIDEEATGDGGLQQCATNLVCYEQHHGPASLPLPTYSRAPLQPPSPPPQYVPTHTHTRNTTNIVTSVRRHAPILSKY